MKQIDQSVNKINSSKIFAGLVVVILNISSKYVNLGLSKSMESYLKHSFSRNIMVAAILWMGSRDIYISIGLTLLFMLFTDVLFNEESFLCIIPEHVKQKISDTDYPTSDEIKKAHEILEKSERLEESESINRAPKASVF